LADLADDVSLEDWITVAAEAYFEAFTTRHDYFILLQFWGVKNPDPELVDAIKEGYDVVHQRLVLLFQFTVYKFDLELIPPYTLDDMAVVATALCEGLALRHRFEPKRVTSEAGPLFGDVVLRMTRSITQTD